jgi:hypothetical protein
MQKAARNQVWAQSVFLCAWDVIGGPNYRSEGQKRDYRAFHATLTATEAHYAHILYVISIIGSPQSPNYQLLQIIGL